MAKGVRLGAWISIFLMLISNAAAISFVSFSGSNTPAQVYETTDSNFTFQISNGLFSLNSVNNVSYGVNGFTIGYIIPLNGWQTSGAIDYFTTTNAISNWGSQNFGFTANANNVDSDTTYNWAVVAIDTNGDPTVFNYQVTVLNDSTPPVMSNVIPITGTFNKGSSSELFSVDAIDAETGVASSNAYTSANCTGNYTATALSNAINTWSSNLDLTADPEGTNTCYYFDSTNHGGATGTTAVYSIMIDRTAPIVTLNNPANGSLVNTTNVTFDFTATDNLATSLNCVLTVDSSQNNMTTYNQTLYVLSLADGQHSWNVGCTDGAGWSTISETRYLTVDTQGPQITINQAQTTFRGISVPLSAGIIDAGVGLDPSTVLFTVTDPNTNISNVPTTQNGNTFSGSYANTVNSPIGTYSLLVNAVDMIGNAANSVMNFILTYSYLLTINSNPNQVNPSDLANNITHNVTVDGTITYDNGSYVPENSLTLTIPDTTGAYTTVSANIVNDAYSYTFVAPEVSGNYVLTASITAGNGYNFSSNTSIYVGLFCGDNSCNNGESCSSCASDCGSCPSGGGGGGGGGGGSSGGGSSGGESSYITPPAAGTNEVIPYIEKKKEEPVVDNSASTPVQTFTPLVEQPIQETPGVGFGFALFSKIKAKWIILLLMGMTLMLLYVFGWRRRGKTDELAEYLERRAKMRQNWEQ